MVIEGTNNIVEKEFLVLKESGIGLEISYRQLNSFQNLDNKTY